jgi:hypothetical protein
VAFVPASKRKLRALNECLTTFSDLLCYSSTRSADIFLRPAKPRTAQINLPEEEKCPLLEALGETLRRHPELEP